jgi:hypothetical protein
MPHTYPKKRCDANKMCSFAPYNSADLRCICRGRSPQGLRREDDGRSARSGTFNGLGGTFPRLRNWLGAILLSTEGPFLICSKKKKKIITTKEKKTTRVAYGCTTWARRHTANPNEPAPNQFLTCASNPPKRLNLPKPAHHRACTSLRACGHICSAVWARWNAGGWWRKDQRTPHK